MSLETLFSDSNADTVYNVAVELSSKLRSSGAAATWKYAYLPVENSSTLSPYLAGIGPLNFSLASDPLFAGFASHELGSLTLHDDSELGAFDAFRNYTFAGLDCIIKIGRVTDNYSSYETYRTCLIESEPSVNGFDATVALQSPLNKLLQEQLAVSHYAGIPTCFRTLTTTGFATVTRVAAYDLTRYTIMLRFRTVTAVAPASSVALFNKRTADTNSNYQIRMLTTGQVDFGSSTGGVANVCYISTTGSYADAEWHSLVVSRDNDVVAYMLMDGEPIDTDTSPGTPDLAVANILFGRILNSGDDIETCDVRLYNRYMAADEARAVATTRSDGSDPGCIGLWRCDDNAGGALADYSSTANNGALGGVLNTDYSWKPTDLGEPELAGTVMPVALGLPYNAPAHLIDQARERYRLSDSDVITGGESQTVRSKGVTLTETTDYTVDGAIVQMVAAEDEPVTFDLVSASPTTFANQWPAVITGLCSSRAGISPNAAQELALPNLLPWNAGWWFDREATAAEIVTEMATGGLSFYEDSSADLFLDFLLPPLSPGPYGGSCVDFRGDSAYFDFGDIADLTGSSGTVACWWKTFATDQGPNNTGATASEQSLVDKTISGTAGYTLEYVMTGTNAGKIRFAIKGSGAPAETELLSPAGLVEEGNWYFTCGVLNTATGFMYIYHGKQGGTLYEVASVSGVTSTIGNSADPLIVGSQLWGSAGFVQVWNVAKSRAQMEAFMTTPPVGNEANLLAYSPMNDGSGSTVAELVASGTGTITTAYPRWRWAPRFSVNLDQTPTIKLKDYHLVQPVGKMVARYDKNFRPMTDADIATSVTQSARLDLRREWKEVPWENATIQGRYDHFRTLIVDTPLRNRVDAQRLLRLLAARFDEDRMTGILDFGRADSGPPLPASRKALGLGFGDEVNVTWTRHGLSSGKAFRVIAFRPDLIQQTCSTGIWG